MGASCSILGQVCHACLVQVTSLCERARDREPSSSLDKRIQEAQRRVVQRPHRIILDGSSRELLVTRVISRVYECLQPVCSRARNGEILLCSGSAFPAFSFRGHVMYARGTLCAHSACTRTHERANNVRRGARNCSLVHRKHASIHARTSAHGAMCQEKPVTSRNSCNYGTGVPHHAVNSVN